jgi:gliding motility-associated-like protein
MMGEAITGLAPGNYTVTVDDGNCFVTAIVNIADIPGPTADFSVNPQVATIDDPLFTFYDNSSGSPVLWSWNFGDNSTSVVQNPVHSYDASGTYNIMLTVENAMGCRDSVMREVIVKDNFLIWLPNAFSPNNDGFNDFFGPKGVGIVSDQYEFYIYNRWGQELFFTHDINMRWDGKVNGNPVKEDVYLWIVVVTGVDGLPYKFHGHVTLIK